MLRRLKALLIVISMAVCAAPAASGEPDALAEMGDALRDEPFELSADELEGMMTTSKEVETESSTWVDEPAAFGKPAAASAEATVRTSRIGSPAFMALIILLAFLLGTVVGAPWMNVQ